jgi:hypothetical protein
MLAAPITLPAFERMLERILACILACMLERILACMFALPAECRGDDDGDEHMCFECRDEASDWRDEAIDWRDDEASD